MRISIFAFVLVPAVSQAGPPAISHYNATDVLTDDDGAVWIIGYDNCDEGGRIAHDILIAGRPTWRLDSPAKPRRDLVTAAMAATKARLFAISRAGHAVYAVGGDGAIVASDDGGKTWTTRKSGLQGDLRAVWARSAREAFVIGTNKLFATNDGKTWRTIAVPSDFVPSAVWGVGDDLYVGGAMRVAEHGSTYLVGSRALVSHDAGKTWRAIAVDDPLAPSSFGGPTADDVYGIGWFIMGAPRVWHSTDRGATWTKLSVAVTGRRCRGG